MVHTKTRAEDLNRVVCWKPRIPDGTPPAGAGVWPRFMGLLTGYGKSHYHFVPDYWCPHIVVRGAGTVCMHGAQHPVGAGDCFCLWPRVPAEYFEDRHSPWEFYWIHLDGAGAESYSRACGFRNDRLVFRAARPARAQAVFANIYDAYAAMMPGGIFQVLSGMYALAPLLSEPREEGTTTEDDTLAKRALAILDSMPQQDWCVEKLAQTLHVDRSTLFRCMQRMGERPSELILRRKIEQAKRFLELTDAKLSVIAHNAGFRNDKYFIRVFREQTGETPNRYRQRTRTGGARDQAADCRRTPEGDTSA